MPASPSASSPYTAVEHSDDLDALSLDDFIGECQMPADEYALVLEDAMFEAILSGAIERPDDELAMNALIKHIVVQGEQGSIERVMQMSVYLGACAMLHPHLEGAANKASDALKSVLGDHDHAHAHDTEDDHDVKNCKECKTGKVCRKKHA